MLVAGRCVAASQARNRAKSVACLRCTLGLQPRQASAVNSAMSGSSGSATSGRRSRPASRPVPSYAVHAGTSGDVTAGLLTGGSTRACMT